jgi:hypothetical protein
LQILRNSLYTGVDILHRSRFGKGKPLVESPPMEHLKIIDGDLFNEVQGILKSNNHNPNRTQRPVVHGRLLLTGLLYCGECGRKFTSYRATVKKQRRDGTMYIYDSDRYRCGSFLIPKEGQPKCNQRIYGAEDLDYLVIQDAKDFLLEVDREKLLRSHEDAIREQEREIGDRLKKVQAEVRQREKEIQKLKDEVVRVVMGESQFSQALLSEMIQTKESELIELRQKQEAAEQTAADLQLTIAARKAVAEEILTWAERFDQQDTTTKKAMLINIIDKITVMADGKINVVYKIKLENMGEEVTDLPPDDEGTAETADIALSCQKNYVKGYALASKLNFAWYKPFP